MLGDRALKISEASSTEKVCLACASSAVKRLAQQLLSSLFGKLNKLYGPQSPLGVR